MKIAFIDANVMFSAAYRNEAKVNLIWQLADTELVTSLYAIAETRRNLKEPKQLEHLDNLVKTMRLADCPVKIEHIIPANIELRAKDRPILAAAIWAKANYLVTGDYRDFGRYFGQTINGVMIVPPAEYLKQYQESH